MISVAPLRWMDGSLTPSESTRLRITSTAWLVAFWRMRSTSDSGRVTRKRPGPLCSSAKVDSIRSKGAAFQSTSSPSASVISTAVPRRSTAR